MIHLDLINNEIHKVVRLCCQIGLFLMLNHLHK
jgi:hypothetical protein